VPEGDTVLVLAGQLHAALAGQVLRRTDVRVPRFAVADLTGQVVREVVARGKHLLLRTDGGATLHTHLKMDGRWDLYRPGARWRGPVRRVRVVLETDPWVAVGSSLGIVELVDTGREEEVLGHLGPDVLGPDWDPDEVLRRLTATPERTVGEAAIDQRVMAGPGNIYRSEALYLHGTDPWTPVAELRDPAGLIDLIKRLMEANRHTGRQVTTGDPRPGRSRWVYGRGGQPCRRCGTPIRQAELGEATQERAVWWCPSCQVRGGREPRGSAPVRSG
jgi:endonuclease-8